MPRLRDWLFEEIPGGARLVGKVYDHPCERHYDGKEVQTSRIVNINMKNREVETHTHVYTLEGPPNEKWKDWILENGYGKDYMDLLIPN